MANIGEREQEILIPDPAEVPDYVPEEEPAEPVREPDLVPV
jgi:hypothetical protein